VVHVAWEHGAVRVTPRAHRCLSVTTLVGVAAVMSWEYDGWQRYAAEPLMALLATCVIAVMVLPGPRVSPLTRLLEARALVAVGIVSYSVYLWHYPLQTWLTERGLVVGGGGAVALAVNAAVLAIATIVLSAATYRWVEKPGCSGARSDGPPLPRPTSSGPAP
jgi:peptidoglycan/LPS O-acetylase OafA/YrhL